MMSNLGWYQVVTTMAKKVHGPVNLGLIVLGTGAAVGTGATLGTQYLIKKVKLKDLERQKSVIYNVYKDSISKEGLSFKKNDQFKILEIDGDAGLIEIIGDDNNPYFVSLKYLASISDYEK